MATIQELEDGLRKADAAGNTDDAKAFADEIRRLRKSEVRVASKPTSPWMPPVGQKLSYDERISPGTAIDVALEGGIPAVAQTLATPLTPAGQAAVGSISSVIGNVLAQARRVATGEQKGMEMGQMAEAGTIGAIPFGGPAANIERVTARQLLKNAGKEAMKVGGAAVAGAEARSLIDDREMAPMQEVVGAGILGGLLGSGSSVFSDIGTNRIIRGREVAQKASELGGMRDSASIGMLMPSEMAATESKLAARNPTGNAAGAAAEGRRAFADEAVKLAPDIEEGDVIYNEIKPKLGAIPKMEEQIAAIGEKAAKANEQADLAFDAVRKASLEGEREVAQVAQKEAEKAFNEAWQTNLEAVRNNAKQVIAEEAAGGLQGINPALAQDIKNEFVVRPAANAVRRQQEALYAPIKGLEREPVFDTAPILARADSVAQETSGGLPGKVDAAIKTVRDILSQPKTSLQDLRNLRSDIYRAIDLNEFGSSNADRLMKQIAGEITAQIDSQATQALGQEAGEQLLKANKFYSETRPIFAEGRINKLLNVDPSGDSITPLINQVRASGVYAPQYRELMEAVEATRKFDPELADGLKNRLNNTIKRSITQKASDSSGKVEAAEIFKYLDDIAKADRSGNSLAEIGFGDIKQVEDLKKLFADYPDASKLTSKQWDDLMTVPAFASEAAKQPIKPDIQKILAITQAENQMVKAANLRAAGLVEDAERLYQKATATASDLGIEQAQMKRRMEELLADPGFVAWGNPKFSADGFNSLKSALFDPDANKVSNADIRELVGRLASSRNFADRDTLAKLQSAYLADKIAVFGKSDAKSLLLEPKADEIAIFFNPANPGNKNNELERFHALFQNDPGAIDRVKQFGKMAKAMEEYEKMAKSPVLPASYNVPVVGEIRRGLDFLGDLYRQGKYDRLAKLMRDPREFALAQMLSGRNIQEATPAIIRGGLGAIRGKQNSPSPQEQRVVRNDPQKNEDKEVDKAMISEYRNAMASMNSSSGKPVSEMTDSEIEAEIKATK
jgi:hypothetical protein